MPLPWHQGKPHPYFRDVFWHIQCAIQHSQCVFHDLSNPAGTFLLGSVCCALDIITLQFLVAWWLNFKKKDEACYFLGGLWAPTLLLPVTMCLFKKFVPTFLISFCPWSLLFSRLNNHNSHSLPSQEWGSFSLVILVALLWIHSNRSMSFLCWRNVISFFPCILWEAVSGFPRIVQEGVNVYRQTGSLQCD